MYTLTIDIGANAVTRNFSDAHLAQAAFNAAVDFDHPVFVELVNDNLKRAVLRFDPERSCPGGFDSNYKAGAESRFET
jgi:hypothetical protein